MSRLVAALVLVVLGAACAWAAPSPQPQRPPMPRNPGSPIAVQVDGKTVDFDVPPQMIGGFVFVPLRGVFEQMGATVAYDRSNGVITADRGQSHVELKVGHRMARVNDDTMFMVQPAISVQGRTLVPLRFLSETLGAAVDWDGGQRLVRITSGGGPSDD